MLRFVAPASRAVPVEPVSGTVVVAATGVILPTHRQATPALQAALDEFDGRVLSLRTEGYTRQEIADDLNTHVKRIERSLRRLRAHGILKDATADLTHHIIPLAIEKLAEKVDAGEWEAIHATLKGVGMFRHYAQTKTDSTERSYNLSVSFELPTDRPALDANPANILGRPRETRHVEETVEGESERDPA